MNRNASVVRFKFRYNILISGKIIKEIPGSVASETPCISKTQQNFIMFIIVLGQLASILIESSSGPSKNKDLRSAFL